jgi:hypothetical protein
MLWNAHDQTLLKLLVMRAALCLIQEDHIGNHEVDLEISQE